ncbi:hypothetical protein EV174_005585 [Coemansia sp. RSA 2320]|nr:hypothetical protein EV174_005585 [Coemansia sp. RSA 2320]
MAARMDAAPVAIAKRRRADTVGADDSGSSLHMSEGKRPRLEHTAQEVACLHCPQPYHSHACLGAASLATPAASPSRDDDGDQSMSGEDRDDLDPASEYFCINSLLNRLHQERELRRLQQRLHVEPNPAS